MPRLAKKPPTAHGRERQLTSTLRAMRHAAFLSHRHRLPQLLAARGVVGTGAEVGVQQGLYSERLLAGSKLSRLILVDPWRTTEDGYDDIANVPQSEHDRRLEEAQTRLARFGCRAEFWRTTSVEAAANVPDASLDFVYLDARHDYESVIEDLVAWYPKVKPGGIFAGHDYLDGERPEGLFGVKSAVDEFFADKAVVVYDTYAEPSWPSWITGPAPNHPAPIFAIRAVLRAARRLRRAVVGRLRLNWLRVRLRG
jgi:hypothetical protein